MWIVRPPHDAIRIQDALTRQDDAGAILLKRRPELPVKVETRSLIQFRLHPAAVVRPPVIHKADQRGYPADTALGHDQAQLGIALRHAGPNQLGDGALTGEDLRLNNPRTDAQFQKAVIDRL